MKILRKKMAFRLASFVMLLFKKRFQTNRIKTIFPKQDSDTE